METTDTGRQKLVKVENPQENQNGLWTLNIYIYTRKSQKSETKGSCAGKISETAIPHFFF
jgi:hypothetical protein